MISEHRQSLISRERLPGVLLTALWVLYNHTCKAVQCIYMWWWGWRLIIRERLTCVILTVLWVLQPYNHTCSHQSGWWGWRPGNQRRKVLFVLCDCSLRFESYNHTLKADDEDDGCDGERFQVKTSWSAEKDSPAVCLHCCVDYHNLSLTTTHTAHIFNTTKLLHKETLLNYFSIEAWSILVATCSKKQIRFNM